MKSKSSRGLLVQKRETAVTRSENRFVCFRIVKRKNENKRFSWFMPGVKNKEQ